MWSDIRRHIRPEPKPDSVMGAPLLCMVMMCIKLANLCINCGVLITVTWFVLLLLLLHIAMHYIYLLSYYV